MQEHQPLGIAREGGGRRRAFSQETCPLPGTGAHSSKSRGIGCTAKNLLKVRGLFVLPFCTQKGLVF